MKRVLVSGASGIVGYGVLRSLRHTGQPCFLVGTSIYDDSVAPAFCDVFEQAPPTNAPEYLDWLLTTLRKHRIELLIPGIDAGYDHAGRIKLNVEVKRGKEVLFPKGQLYCALHGTSDGIKARELVLSMVAEGFGESKYNELLAYEAQYRYCDKNGKLKVRSKYYKG